MKSLLHYLTLPYITLHYHTFPFEISSPCTKTELMHMLTRLYNAAASPASRLHSAGSLAINPKFFTLYNYYITKRGSILSIFHGGQQLHFFKKSSIRLPVSWNISITAKKKKTFLLMDSKRDRYLQWLPTMIRNETPCSPWRFFSYARDRSLGQELLISVLFSQARRVTHCDDNAWLNSLD